MENSAKITKGYADRTYSPKLKEVLLWQNPDTDSEFIAQDITDDTTQESHLSEPLYNFDVIIIETYYSNSIKTIELSENFIRKARTIFDVNERGIVQASGEKMFIRGTTLYMQTSIPHSYIRFGDAKEIDYTNNCARTTRNNMLIPYKIYGIKF